MCACARIYMCVCVCVHTKVYSYIYKDSYTNILMDRQIYDENY